jgi:hypothetical protein
MHKPETMSGNAPENNPLLPGGLIPIEEWMLPGASVSRTLVGTVGYWLEQLRAEITRPDESFDSLDGLPELSADQLQQLAPEPDCQLHGQALTDAVQRLREADQCRRSVLLLVAPPFTGVAQALRCFPDCKTIRQRQDAPEQGGSKNYRLILPPVNLLMDAETARQWWQNQPMDQPWVISELAAFWRRHHDGLALVQELLRLLAADQAGEGVIGCSSWCWQFWSNYYPDAQLTPWVPAPMTDERLGLWLQQLACRNGAQIPVVRTTTDGLYVLPLESADDKEQNKKRKHANLLRNLAADSRGIPGVALAIWQRALRARPEVDADDTADESTEQGNLRGNTAHSWVVPLSQLRLPVMPVSQERNFGLVLHALLLHEGLTIADLGLVTAIHEPDLSLALSRLLRADIISAIAPTAEQAEHIAKNHLDATVDKNDAESKIWRVTPLGYPTTRRHLQSWGFPLDVF